MFFAIASQPEINTDIAMDLKDEVIKEPENYNIISSEEENACGSE